MKKYSVFAALLFCFSGSPDAALAEGCLTGGCHQGLVGKRILHRPSASGECLSCHEQKADGHAGITGKSFHVPLSGSRLCYQCHEEPMDQGIMHAPVAAGDCISCHDPHGSDFTALLKKQKPDLCFRCHDDLRSMTRARTKHAPLYRPQSCGECHSAHSSDAPALLLSGERELCLSCHGQDTHLRSKPLRNIARELEENPFLHSPVVEGRCSACHAPHGSENYRLLQGSYPQGPYAPYKKGAYDFCFRCHDPNLLNKANMDTGFRNSSRNLHHLHVASPSKGRVCTTCHAPHAARNPHLINERTRFGDWEMPINFEATSTGGSCAPGCHQAVHYDRTRP